MPKRKRKILKIINPETGDNIFNEIEEIKHLKVVKENNITKDFLYNNQETCSTIIEKMPEDKTFFSQASSIQSLNCSTVGTSIASFIPFMENINNNRTTMSSNTLEIQIQSHVSNTYAPNKMMCYDYNAMAKSQDSFSFHKLQNNYGNYQPYYQKEVFDHNFYPPCSSEQLLMHQSHQQPSQQHFPQQAPLYPHRNYQYYNTDVCYYPPSNSAIPSDLMNSSLKENEVTNNQLKITTGCSDKLQVIPSNENSTVVKTEQKITSLGVSETFIMANNSKINTNHIENKNKIPLKDESSLEPKKKLTVNCLNKNTNQVMDAKSDILINNDKEQSDVLADSSDHTTNPHGVETDLNTFNSKNLDPNAKSFIFTGMLSVPAQAFMDAQGKYMCDSIFCQKQP